jgi:hypothetical protein
VVLTSPLGRGLGEGSEGQGGVKNQSKCKNTLNSFPSPNWRGVRGEVSSW